MELLVLPQADFLAALTGQVGTGSAPADVFSYPKATTLTRRQRVEILSRVSLLSHLEFELAARARRPGRCRAVGRGRDNHPPRRQGDRFFVMLDGRAHVSAGDGVVHELRAGDQFGEIALLHDVPRRANVTAASRAVTLSLPRDAFVSAVRSRLIAG